MFSNTFNIYFVPSSCAPNIGEMRVEIGQKRTISSTLRAPAPRDFSHRNAYYQDPNNTVDAFFWNNLFLTVFV